MKIAKQKQMSRIKKIFLLFSYYAFIMYLPEGYDHPVFQWCNRLRFLWCRGLFKNCGVKVSIHRKARFGSGSNIEIGDYANLGRNCYINGRGGVSIGKNVLMGPDVIIYSGTHTYRMPDIPIQFQPMKYENVVIGDDVWLGARSIVLPGVVIGSGSIIGSNSVVTKSIPENTIATGVPAKILKKRY